MGSWIPGKSVKAEVDRYNSVQKSVGFKFWDVREEDKPKEGDEQEEDEDEQDKDHEYKVDDVTVISVVYNLWSWLGIYSSM